MTRSLINPKLKTIQLNYQIVFKLRNVHVQTTDGGLTGCVVGLIRYAYRIKTQWVSLGKPY